MFTYKAADGKTTLHGHDCSFRRTSIRRRSIRCSCRVYGGPASASNTRDARRSRRRARSTEYGFLVVNLDSRAAPGHGQADARRDLPEARPGRDRRHGRGREGAVEPPVLRQDARRHLRHVVRRLLVGDVDPAASRRLRGGVGLVAGDRRGTTTTRSTPSATCGFRRRTRTATTPAAP